MSAPTAPPAATNPRAHTPSTNTNNRPQAPAPAGYAHVGPSEDTIIDHGSAALGTSTNQVSELFAIGMVLQSCMNSELFQDKTHYNSTGCNSDATGANPPSSNNPRAHATFNTPDTPRAGQNYTSNTNNNINLHIWTDSKTCYGIFAKKWRSKNPDLTDLVRSAIFKFRSRKGATLTFHWCPAWVSHKMILPISLRMLVVLAPVTITITILI